VADGRQLDALQSGQHAHVPPGDGARPDQADPHALPPSPRERARHWYWATPLVAAVVQIIIAEPDGNGGHETSTPRDFSRSRTSPRSSPSHAIWLLRGRSSCLTH